MAINWDKKVSVLKTWGAGLGGLFLLSQIFKGELFSGHSSFGENVILAVFTFLLPPLGVFLFYWPQTQSNNVSSPSTPLQEITPTNATPSSSPPPIPPDAGHKASQPQPVSTGWSKKKIWIVVIGIFVAYKIITSLYIGHQKAELNDLINQIRLQQR